MDIKCGIKIRSSKADETGGIIYDWVCYDPDTGLEYNRIPLTTEASVKDICYPCRLMELYWGTYKYKDEYYEKCMECRDRYLELEVRLTIYNEDLNKVWAEIRKLIEFYKSTTA
jgi:hypothetical protein